MLRERVLCFHCVKWQLNKQILPIRFSLVNITRTSEWMDRWLDSQWLDGIQFNWMSCRACVDESWDVRHTHDIQLQMRSYVHYLDRSIVFFISILDSMYYLTELRWGICSCRAICILLNIKVNNNFQVSSAPYTRLKSHKLSEILMRWSMNRYINHNWQF